MTASVRNIVIALALLGTVEAASGCSGTCAQAADLCKECELRIEDCDSRFDDASSDYCEGAVDVYEQSCPAVQ